MARYEDYYDPDLHGINEDEECPYMDGGGDECYYCRYYHDPCFPDLGDDDE